MRITSLRPNLLLVLLLSLALAPLAFAAGRGGGSAPGHGSSTQRGGAHAPTTAPNTTPSGTATSASTSGSTTIQAPTAEDRGRNGSANASGDHVDSPAQAAHASDAQNGRKGQGCQRGGRSARTGGCDYYYDEGEDDEAYGDEVVKELPSHPAPRDSRAGPAESSGPAKIAPAPASGETTSFTPSHPKTDGLRDKMVQGRKDWLEKKKALDDINTAVARSTYQAMQSGSQVDPRLVEQQERAQTESQAARAALTPLVDQAREAGMSPRSIDLYVESISGH